MVLTDDAQNQEDAPGGSRPFKPYEAHHNIDEEHLWEFKRRRTLVTGSIKVMDYNFKTPTAAMEADTISSSVHPNGTVEGYDFPGDYLDQSDGKRKAALRMRQAQGQSYAYQAKGDCMSLKSGMLVTLEGIGQSPAEGGTFLCLSATHTFTSDSYGSGGSDAGTTAYEGTYSFMPVEQPLAPERTKATSEPRIQGLQTGVVTGGGELDPDGFGRILVEFPWLAGAASMRCRVSQALAGDGWGMVATPRIGMEVIVEFVNGDINYPLVTGCLYNGKNGLPYAHPDMKTRTVLKTSSHEGEGFNEIRIEDKGGEEEIFIHAQKDRNEKTLNNHSERIDNNWTQSVGGNKGIDVEGSHGEAIGGGMKLQVGPSAKNAAAGGDTGNWEGIGPTAVAVAPPVPAGDMHVDIDANFIEQIGINSVTTVGAAMNVTVGATYTLAVGQAMAISGGAGLSMNVSESVDTAIGQDANTQIQGDEAISVGRQSVESIGKKKIIDVGDELILKVGKAQITMKKNGDIEIKGKTIEMDASSKVNVDASSTIKLKASKIHSN